MAASHTSEAEAQFDETAPIRRVHVLLPLPLASAYDYAVPREEYVEVGDFVAVPLGRRTVAGVVWGEGSADPDNAVADSRLRPIAQRLPVPAMAEVTRRFVEWLADYTCAAPGAVLRMTMSVPAALEPPRPRLAYVLDGPPPDRMTGARQRVLAVLADGQALPSATIAELAAVSGAVVRGLVKHGTLREVQLPAELPVPEPDWRKVGETLSADQLAAAAALKLKVEEGGYSTTLLDGVTGAGKTEVYLEAVAATLAQDRQVLVLVPEIGLTAQWLERFERRFGAAPLAWHSDLGTARRRLTWRAVAQGRARVVVGARSALFLPYTDLGLIVVDEEHDAAFKQEDGVIYHARDMAVLRASLGEIPIVLVSATPSLESRVNVESGRYDSLHLPNRIGAAELPQIEAVDMRGEAPPGGQWLSETLVTAMKETLEAGEQVLLFLNRRGYAPLTLCRTCGHRLQCPHCTAWLVEHRFHGRLQCHHCGFTLRQPEACPECEAEGSLVACGPGVERLGEEVDSLFPDIPRMLIASDTVRGPEAAAEAIRMIAEGEVSLIIGTQIVAKGHHFPLLTLVGVIDADLGLQGGDLRAAERTYQVLNQVAGRAGRAQRPGRALLQTYMPEHPVMQALISGDRDNFMARERQARQFQGLPPFGRLVALIVSGRNEAQVLDSARELGRAAPRQTGVDVLGPAPAPLSLLRGRFRQRLLLKCQRGINASALARTWVDQVHIPNQVRVAIDVDPYSFM
ncbi:MAG: primosomal protein N' [Alphaproteobacteria bacterium]|jgi:primosomal protein N' (replication factor Y)|nr:primosomal protein N' [Alphaproteobacteria bacterium]MDP6832363.1 primosomal protein N' [Alphaproteobacteria bacterium]MDP6873748.1 primosomal protein N' [Alphaproteobacteria bacterium]